MVGFQQSEPVNDLVAILQAFGPMGGTVAVVCAFVWYLREERRVTIQEARERRADIRSLADTCHEAHHEDTLEMCSALKECAEARREASAMMGRTCSLLDRLEKRLEH